MRLIYKPAFRRYAFVFMRSSALVRMCRYRYRHISYTKTCVRKAFMVGPADRMREYQDLTPASWHDAAGLVGVLIAVLPGVPSHAERSFWLVLWLGDYYDLARLASCCMALRPSSHVWCWSCNETQPCTWRFLRYRGIPMRIEELVHHAWNDCCHQCAMARRRDDDAKPFVYAGRYSEYDGARRLACRARAAEVGWGYSSPELSD